MNRNLLGKVLEHMYAFRSQKYTSIACSILMINAAKLKIPKLIFNRTLESVETLKRTNLTSVCSIKKSKAFALIKSFVKV